MSLWSPPAGVVPAGDVAEDLQDTARMTTRRPHDIPPRPDETETVLPASVPFRPDTFQDQGELVATREHAKIRAWAEQHRAEPATGAATDTGGATFDVQDGGATIRLNFPAAAPFRPITWDEWFALFDRDDLVFVYEPPYARGGAFRTRGDSYYRLVRASDWYPSR